jgi:hypothetical protein
MTTGVMEIVLVNLVILVVDLQGGLRNLVSPGAGCIVIKGLCHAILSNAAAELIQLYPLMSMSKL